MFKLFKRKKAVISVPEIKEYLVKEFEKVEILTKTIHELEAELEKAEEIKHQYDAALVTLDKYKRRLEIADLSAQKVKKAHSSVYEKYQSACDELNSYKIKFNELAQTKEAIKLEIVDQFKTELISIINNHRGNLSKKTVSQIISEAQFQ